MCRSPSSLTRIAHPQVNDVTGWAPSKDDALAYLSGATSKPPARYALARVVFGSDNPRVEVCVLG